VDSAVINLFYLGSSVLFILGLKGLSHPRTAVRGNLIGALGMLAAVIATFLYRDPFGNSPAQAIGLIVAAVLVGSLLGALLALKIQMTAMPQMVALLNGFGGAASVLVAGAALVEMRTGPGLVVMIATAASGIIGAVTFWGSLVAFDKLQEVLLPGRPIHFPGQQPLNVVLGIVVLALSAWLSAGARDANFLYWAIVLISSVLGVLLTIPIGGADMPVAIALLNSYSGLAGSATGFVLGNEVLIITGSLVGASGIILAQIMCKAMNRSLANVLLGNIAVGSGSVAADDVYAGRVKGATAEDLAMLFDGAQRVVIVPGYGMAVSQAQHAVRDLVNLLESKGTEVEFAIHPVAGRMPGHMNVLLAEADIPYDKLKEMDEINASFQQTDVAVVIGANDVVNPLARTDPSSPIAGMPILDVDKAKTVVVIKRSLSPGFAGIPNPLFAADNTLMYFADGKKAIVDLIAAIKAA
jgi:NAD(P) transhydrogenase subunit beta